MSKILNFMPNQAANHNRLLMDLSCALSIEFCTKEALSVCTWALLQFDHLFVCEEAAVVDESHGVEGLTVGAD